MKRLALAGALLATGFLVACTEPSLVGTWVSEGVGRRTVELAPDGTAVFTLDVAGGVSFRGKYTVSGNRIVVTDIQPPDGLPLAAIAQSFVPEKVEGTFSWKNPREVVFSGDRFLKGGYRRKE
ncbi:MAG: hypothetical protein KF857_11515 [Fimbriimonadaceae bacterium]|nr:hypothetical protein [Fimbriimonadaceae bacterium]